MLLAIGIMNPIKKARKVAFEDGTTETSAMFCLSGYFSSHHRVGNDTMYASRILGSTNKNA